MRQSNGCRTLLIEYEIMQLWLSAACISPLGKRGKSLTLGPPQRSSLISRPGNGWKTVRVGTGLTKHNCKNWRAQLFSKASTVFSKGLNNCFSAEANCVVSVRTVDEKQDISLLYRNMVASKPKGTPLRKNVRTRQDSEIEWPQYRMLYYDITNYY